MREERPEMGADFYDEYVIASEGYLGPSEQIMCYPMWLVMLKYIDKSEKIFDLGCGPGQLADIAFKNGYTYAKGVDFSKEMIRIAKERLPEHQDRFKVANLYDADTYAEDYDVIVLSEVLEHIKDDLKVIGYIERGKHIVASLPSFDYISHVRYFDCIADIQDRYSDILQIDIEEFIIDSQLFFILNGNRK